MNKIPPSLVILLVAAYSSVPPIYCGPSLQSGTVHIQNEPGNVETFLATYQKAVVGRKPLGTLAASGESRAIFTAIVAEDKPSRKKVKGLQVDLRDTDQKALVYIDEDGLKELDESLKSMLGTQRFISEHSNRYGPADLRVPHTTSAINRSPATGEFYGVLEVGFYQHESGFGVYLYAPPGTRHRSVQLWLPNVDISQVLIFVESGRTFLTAN